MTSLRNELISLTISILALASAAAVTSVIGVSEAKAQDRGSLELEDIYESIRDHHPEVGAALARLESAEQLWKREATMIIAATEEVN